MLIRRRDLEKLSADVRRIIDGQDLDLRDNREGILPMLKNDINTLARLKSEQIEVLRRDHDSLRRRLEDISHQLKTPLTSTMIMADLLDDAPPHKQAEFIQNIRQSLSRMEWLVATLLKIAQLDTGVVNFASEPVQATELIELALEPLAIQLEMKDQCVEVTGAVELLCDKRWTAEAISNIVKNASEHSPAGGQITVEAGDNPICSWITITDSGPGLTMSDLATIFTRFEGSHSAQGYGIGLPLALAIMREQNGDIEVDPGGKPGGGPSGGVRGASFTLKFFK